GIAVVADLFEVVNPVAFDGQVFEVARVDRILTEGAGELVVGDQRVGEGRRAGAAFVDRAVRDAAVDATRADPVVAAGDEVVFDHRPFDAGVDADFFDFLTADELVVRGDVDHAFPVRSQRAFRTGETFFR